jgi:tRNA1(Val) A37 N6-methylase TrmN6
MRAKGTGLSDPVLPAGITEDAFLGGALTLRQPANGYRAAIDPVFLAAAVAAAPGQTVLDAGAGHGAAALCLARRVEGVRVTGIELQADMVRLANDNARLNGLERSVQVMIGDLTTPLPRVVPGSFDHAMANPPYLDAGRADVSLEPGRATANVEGAATLADWIGFLLRMVKAKGSVTVIQRADRLGEILALLDGRAGDIVVYPLWPKEGVAARRVLVRARKGIRTPMTVSPGMVLHRDDGGFTPAADAVLRGAALDIAAART